MMENFWEMYTAYTSKKDTDPIEQTAWGRSPCTDYKVPEGGKANGRFWLEQCDRHVNIQVVGKLSETMISSVPDSCTGVFDTVGRPYANDAEILAASTTPAPSMKATC